MEICCLQCAVPQHLATNMIVDDWLAFQGLAECSMTSSKVLELSLKPGYGTSSLWTVALLCPSSVEFLFTWLGLMRLGYAVLLIAYGP